MDSEILIQDLMCNPMLIKQMDSIGPQSLKNVLMNKAGIKMNQVSADQRQQINGNQQNQSQLSLKLPSSSCSYMSNNSPRKSQNKILIAENEEQLTQNLINSDSTTPMRQAQQKAHQLAKKTQPNVVYFAAQGDDINGLLVGDIQINNQNYKHQSQYKQSNAIPVQIYLPILSGVISLDQEDEGSYIDENLFEIASYNKGNFVQIRPEEEISRQSKGNFLDMCSSKQQNCAGQSEQKEYFGINDAKNPQFSHKQQDNSHIQNSRCINNLILNSKELSASTDEEIESMEHFFQETNEADEQSSPATIYMVEGLFQTKPLFIQ
ncbi:hypothetical protein FGO68_gene2254 [Halteria grandinella]|uniref:Uncharacterized protein n=1 Tax=Halteria grandinella TaxID=5974 RepID=A0A8J8NS58_HALGN|nr:hypothetical protein FGO68_gene2254 [Halteria grandinella]